MRQKNNAVHDIYLEQAALNELETETYNKLQEEPRFSEEKFQKDIESIKLQNEAFHNRFDQSAFLKQIREKAFTGDLADNRIAGAVLEIKSDASPSEGESRQKENRKRWKKIPLAIAAAIPVFLILSVIFRFPGAGTEGLIDGIRSKGLEPKIFIYRDLGNGDVELLRNSAKARENDTLQISYLATGKNYGVIVSIDGASVITLHYPENSDMLPRLQPQDEVYLPYAYKLDDAPEYERFFFITSDEAFDVQQLLSSISPMLKSSDWNQHGDLDLPEEFDIHRIDLVKPGRER